MHRDAETWLAGGDLQAIRDHMDVIDTMMAPHGRWKKLCRCGLYQRLVAVVNPPKAMPERGLTPAPAGSARAASAPRGLSADEERLAMDTTYFGPNLGWGIKVMPRHL